MLSENVSREMSLSEINDMTADQLILLQQTVTMRLKEEHDKQLLADINSVEMEKNQVSDAIMLHESKLIELKLQIIEEEFGLGQTKRKLIELEEKRLQLLKQARAAGLTENVDENENSTDISLSSYSEQELLVIEPDDNTNSNNNVNQIILEPSLPLSSPPPPPPLPVTEVIAQQSFPIQAFIIPETTPTSTRYLSSSNIYERQAVSGGGRRYVRQRSAVQPRPCQVLPEPLPGSDYYNGRSLTASDSALGIAIVGGSGFRTMTTIAATSTDSSPLRPITSSNNTEGNATTTVITSNPNGASHILSCTTTTGPTTSTTPGVLTTTTTTTTSLLDVPVEVVSARRTLSLSPMYRPRTFRSAEAEDVPPPTTTTSTSSSRQYTTTSPATNSNSSINSSTVRFVDHGRSRAIVGHRWRNVRSANPFLWRGNAVLDDSEADLV